jgi:hypothetical protein
MQSFSQVIEQERRRWMPFRRALSQEDQGVFDRVFADAAQQLQAEVYLGRPWRFEVVLVAVLLVHEKIWRRSCVGLKNWRPHPDRDRRARGGSELRLLSYWREIDIWIFIHCR